MNFAPFDAAEYLDSEETIAEYLTAALEDPNPDVFLAAVRDVDRTRGMAQLANIGYQGFRQSYSSIPIQACGWLSANSPRASSASPIIKRLLCPAFIP